uniref:Uncharacterized protein n=1 Tax=Anguilla anguilla TaxID=7936 RepID=A0A0E9VG14_ANGAN
MFLYIFRICFFKLAKTHSCAVNSVNTSVTRVTLNCRK